MRKLYAIPLWLIALLLVLIGIRAALPYLVEDYVNGKLARMGDYSGRVADVDLAVWRGAYRLHGLRVGKTGGEVPVPLLAAPWVDISMSWRDLWRGKVVAEVAFERPEVHFVDGRGDQDSQSGRGVDWRERLEALVPTRIDVVSVHDGTVVFHNFLSNPPVDVETTNVQATIRNLTNVRDVDGRRVAELEATAAVLGDARLESEARFDPFGRMETFSFALRLLEVDLTAINDLARAYFGIDFESGNGEFVMELEAEDGRLSGYAKPLFQHIRIFSWGRDEQEGNPFRIAWEALAEAVTSLLKNQPADQFATRIEIRGNIDNPDLDIFSAIAGILRNAFGEALKPYFEGVHLQPRPDPGD